MNLLEFARERIIPTTDQERALQTLDDFFHSDCKCFLLKGYAGTGKTTIIKTIAEYIEQLKWKVVLLAPTGRAARILSDKTGFEACTIHRGIYNLDDIDELESIVKDKIQYKFRFNLQTVNINTSSVYIIDEASMISDKKAEQDFFIFGSGILLKDIITYIAPTNNLRNVKIIFAGDPAQLPPVTDSISGALSSKYLFEKYQIHSKEFELTQVVRQTNESGILVTANSIRERLTSKTKKGAFNIDDHFDDISIVNSSKVADQYIEQNSYLTINKAAIINYSNASALDYNLLVREKIFKNKYLIAQSDILIINQNNYNYDIELFNGTMIKVIDVNPMPITKSNIKSYDQNGKECKVNLKFREITVSVPNDKDEVILRCLILDNFLYSKNPQLDYSEHIALYLDFKIRHPNLKPKTKEFKDALRSDPFFNALRVKYGYAITCHKAQGGEWESVFVNLDLNLGRQSETFNRWLYTAITRAKDHLYIFNYNAISPFTDLKIIFSYIPDLESTGKVENIYFKIDSHFLALEEQFHFGARDYFIREKFKEIVARANHFQYQIVAHSYHNFQEQFTFEKEGSKGTLIFWYTAQKKFSKVVIHNTPSNNLSFCQQLLQDFSKPLNIIFEEQFASGLLESMPYQEQESIENLFPVGTENMKTLYDCLLPGLSERNISITQVIHAQDQEVYSFKRENENAKVRIYYNGKHLFTNASNLIKDCNSNNLLSDIEAVLLELKNLE